MAKINQGILGGFSGSVANIVGSSWKGIAVMKAKPLSVANPRTAKQVAQRVKFRAGSELTTSLKNLIIKPFWDRFATRMSGVNAWMSQNVEKYSDTGAPDLSTLVMSKGNIGVQEVTSVEYDTSNHHLTADWSGESTPANGLDTDEAAVCVVAPSNSAYGIREAGIAVRSDGGFDIDLTGETPIPPSSHAYIMFKRPDGTIVSDSSNVDVTIS